MMMRKSFQWIIVTTLICGLGMFTSCSTDDHGAVEPKLEPGAEYRAMLKSLDWGLDTTFVYGHKVPDVDAACSSLSYAKLMRALGYNCKAKVSSPINRETQYIAQRFGFDVPELKTEVAAGTRLILTDHTDYAQCVDGAKEAKILQKIDHHVEGDIKDSGIPFVRREMIGSTCTIIYECYNELGVAIDDETAKILLAGLLSDTRNLAKSSTQHEDSVAWLALVTQLKLEDEVAEISRQMADAANNYDGMSDSAIFVSDYKDYEIGGKAIGIGSLECKADKIEDFINRMLAVMPTVMRDNHRDMLFCKIDILVPNPDESDPDTPYVEDGLYFIYYGEGTQDVAETIFGPSLRDGVTQSKEHLSRKQIVPLIMEILQ
jgi:manganese-dependent inorganic pyrophosphatase